MNLEKVLFRKIPHNVKKIIQSQSTKYIETRKNRKVKITDIYVSNLSEDEQVYIVEQTKTYAGTTNDTEKITHFIYTHKNIESGYLEIRLNITNTSQYFVNKPFVGFTVTREGFKKQRLGTKRLEIANTYCIKRYDLPLYSDTLITDQARKIWEELERKGQARKIKEGKNDRFHFIHCSI